MNISAKTLITVTTGAIVLAAITAFVIGSNGTNVVTNIAGSRHIASENRAMIVMTIVFVVLSVRMILRRK